MTHRRRKYSCVTSELEPMNDEHTKNIRISVFDEWGE